MPAKGGQSWFRRPMAGRVSATAHGANEIGLQAVRQPVGPRPRAYEIGHGRYGIRINPVWVAHFLVVGALLTSAILTIYYYNRLTELEADVDVAKAQVDRELQRRADLIRNLVPPVFAYADLERHVFTEVAKVRTQLTANARDMMPSLAAQKMDGGAAPQGVEQLGEILGRLVALSEQYPDMKASAPFEILMQKVTETEDRVASARQTYSERVNRYTTVATTFPGRLFATVFRFDKSKPFLVIAPEARLPPEIRRPQPDRPQ